MVDNLSWEGPGGVGLYLAEALLPLAESPDAPPIPWLCSTRYKTELCSRYAETGDCKFAERCQFAHGLHELHMPSHHPKYKTELCHTYHTTGYCLYGTSCLFVHDPIEQRTARSRRRNIPCRTYCSFGVCPFGTRCKFLHIEGHGDLESPDGARKTPSPPPSISRPLTCHQSQECAPHKALCRTFNSFGYCLYGTRCRYHHELPSTVKAPPASQRLGSVSSPPQLTLRVPSPGSEMFSPSPVSSSPPSALSSPMYLEDVSPALTTPLNDPMAHNAFSFSSQHLNDLLLPLALHLQQLEERQTMAAAARAHDVWGNKAFF